MKINRRLRKLEENIDAGNGMATLYFDDGPPVQIAGPSGDLFFWLSRENPPPKIAKQLELVRKCVRSEEPGGSRFLELIHALQHTPTTPESAPTKDQVAEPEQAAELSKQER